MVMSEETLIVPGVFDMVSAKIAAQEKHHAIYMSGYATVASHLGLPDAGLASYAEMVERAAAIASSVDIPLIADTDTGFGGLLNIRHTVKGFERAGVRYSDRGPRVSEKVWPYNRAPSDSC